MVRVCCLIAMLAMSSALDTEVGLSFDVAAAKNRPVTKVINLLKEMLATMQKEAEEDEEIYDKLTCWCETNRKEKTKAIADADVRIEQLTTSIEELTADTARLRVEIKNHAREVAEDQDALDKATGIRQKELAEFTAEEKDLLQSITALKSAVTVLSKHHNFLQMPRTQLTNVAATLQQQMEKHASLLEGVLTHTERKTVASFIQQSYAPQSGEIFGILKQMQETFETNLATLQKEEAENLAAYEDLKAAKEAEIKAGQDQFDAKTQALATADETLANNKEDLENTKSSLGADEEFLAMLNEKCSMTDGEYEERVKTRQLEMEAVSKALAFLTSDDAHDLFTKTFNPALVQKEDAVQSARRAQASAVLAKTSSPRLVALSYSMKRAKFTRVKKAIDDMVTQLEAENADEIAQRNYCIEQFNKNELETESKSRNKRDLEAKIADLSAKIKALADAIAALEAEVKEMQVQLKRAGEDRELENKDFQTVIADQRATQKLLQATLGVLEGFYKKDAVLVQEPAGPPPPAGFEEYKKNESSGGVMKMIQDIITDAKTMESDAIHDEENSQKAYEEFVKETNTCIVKKNRDIVDKSEEKAKAETDLVKAKKDLKDTILTLEQLSNFNAQLHTSCDFVLKNFEIRQTARAEEIEALRQAKAILSGSNFEAFLQHS